MDTNLPHIFADMVVNVSHANGVFRITFAQQGPDRSVKQVMDLMVPGSQLAGMLQGINQAASEIAEKVRGQDDDAAPAKKPAPKKKKAPAKKA